MNAAEITALSTGIPAIIAAITGLVAALKAKGTATSAQAQANFVNGKLNDHIVKVHDAFPIQPESSTPPGPMGL